MVKKPTLSTLNLYDQLDAPIATEEIDTFYRLATDLTRQYIYVVQVQADGRLNLVHLSKNFFEILGYSLHELSDGQVFESVVYPMDQAILWQHIMQLQKGFATKFECRVVTKDQEIRWVRNIVEPKWDASQGRVTYIYGLGQDITEEYYRYNRMKATLEAMPDLLIYYDAQGNYLECRAIDELDLPVPKANLVGKNVYDILPLRYATETITYIRQTLETNLIQTYQYEMELHGEKRFYEARMVKCGEEEVVCIIRNITAQKQAEVDKKNYTNYFHLLSQVETQFGYQLHIQATLDKLLQVVMNYLQAASGVIAYVDLHDQQLKPICQQGKTHLLNQNWQLDDLKNAQYQKNVVVEAFQKPSPHLKTGLENNIPYALLPLLGRDETRGVLLVEDFDFSLIDEEALKFLELIARRVAITIQNADFFNQSENYAQQMQILYDFSQVVGTTLQVEEVIQLGLQVLTVLMKNSYVFYASYRPYQETVTFEDFSSFSEDYPYPFEKGASLSRSPIFSRLLKIRRPVLLRAKDTTLTPIEQETLTQLGIKTLFLIPVIVKDTLWGIIGLSEAEYDRYFTSDEEVFCTNLVRHLEVNLQQIDLITHLQDVERVKSQMITIASHDLRQPLAQIKGYAEMVMQSLGDQITPKQQEYLGKIESGTQKIRQQLEDILNLERLESPAGLEWRNIKLANLVEEVFMSQYDQARAKHQTYQVQIPSSLPVVLGNPTQLEHAFLNLVQNAIKYTPEGGSVTIRVEVEADRVLFKVEDTGYGIPQELQPRLFERFYRANRPEIENISGTGLGLSLVKGIVERHGGGILFESQVGVGSIFALWLPLAPCSTQ